MQTRIAALYVALTYHLQGNRATGPTPKISDITKNMTLYETTLEGLERAAEKLNDTALTAKVDLCRQTHQKVLESNKQNRE